MKILIIGLSKSGTTGLFYQIKNSITAEVEGIFERNALEQKFPLLQSDKNVVTKLLLFPGYLQQNYYDSVISLHDKKIFIIRDPRDNMVSELLYFGGYHVIWEKPSYVRRESIKLLKEKEKHPKNVSMIALFNKLCDRPSDKLKAYTIERFESVIKFVRKYPDFHVIKYEDFINYNVAQLEQYLELPLEKNTIVDNKHNYVIRTKKSGNWVSWFTQEDVEFFKPLMQEYITTFGYDNLDWKLDESPNILSRYSSEYFAKLISNKRRLEGKETFIEKLSRKVFR